MTNTCISCLISSFIKEFINEYPQYIKRISPLGHVENILWVNKYKAMKKAASIESTGYV